MTLLYAREINQETKEYEVINQEDAKAKGWKQYDVEFDMLNNKWYLVGYVPAAPEPTYEEVKTTRANLYAAEVDPLMAEYNRKKTFNLFEEGEEAELLKAIEDKVAEIKENNPYPVVEEVPAEAEPVEESEVIEDGLQREETEVVY